MSLTKLIQAQRDFTAGEINSAAIRGDDMKIYDAALRVARNVRVINERGLQKRPGTRAVVRSTGKSITFEVTPKSGVTYKMTLSDGVLQARRDGFVVSDEFTGLRWTEDELTSLSYEMFKNELFVCMPSGLQPHVFTYDDDTETWSEDDFNFDTGAGGQYRQPFYRFGDLGVTLSPSARTGAINITFSGDVLVAGHVGVVFRYASRQMLITGVTNATTGTATVIEELPPTFDVLMNSVTGFQIGDLVEGVTSGCTGQIISFPAANTMRVVITKNYLGFTAAEKVATATTYSTVTSQAAAPSLGATNIWDEAFVSDVRGWPRSVSQDSQRLIFSNFSQLGNGILWSAIAGPRDFYVGTSSDEAMFENVPTNCTISHVVGGADEFVFTNKGVYYIPISASNPLRPGSVEFRQITIDAASEIRPASMNEGLIFVSGGGNRVMAIVGTGQTARPYIVEDLTEYHTDLIRDPVVVAATSGDGDQPERYLWCLNGDGTIAVARYDKGKQIVGWVLWEGVATFEYLAAVGGSVLFSGKYDFGGDVVRLTTELDFTIRSDGIIQTASGTGEDGLELETAVFFLLDETEPLTLGEGALHWAAGQPCDLFYDGEWQGTFTLTADGLIADPPVETGVALIEIGFPFTSRVMPFVGHGQNGVSQGQRTRLLRVAGVTLHITHKYSFVMVNQIIPSYSTGDNQNEPPITKTKQYTRRMLGRSHDPEVVLTCDTPDAFEVHELTLEVTL